MDIREAVEKSNEKLTVFIVKEALFCKAYEESAWRFVALIKPYKPSRKSVKKLNMDVVSIGFPKSQLSTILALAQQNGFTLEQEESGSLILKILSEPETSFADWKQNVAINDLEKPDLKGNNITGNQAGLWAIVREVEQFSIAENSPMRCMQFLSELQNSIKLVKNLKE